MSDPFIGTTYQANNYCHRCTRRIANGEAGTAYATMMAALGAWAQKKRIVLNEESSWDSEDFPKPFRRSQVEPGERCGRCHIAIK